MRWFTRVVNLGHAFEALVAPRSRTGLFLEPRLLRSPGYGVKRRHTWTHIHRSAGEPRTMLTAKTHARTRKQVKMPEHSRYFGGANVKFETKSTQSESARRTRFILTPLFPR